jgi:hypothetical protein
MRYTGPAPGTSTSTPKQIKAAIKKVTAAQYAKLLRQDLAAYQKHLDAVAAAAKNPKTPKPTLRSDWATGQAVVDAGNPLKP